MTTRSRAYPGCRTGPTQAPSEQVATLDRLAASDIHYNHVDVLEDASEISEGRSDMTLHLLDPLLQPFRLKNVTLRNRVVSTSHEPSYTEDGMPKRRYR